MFTNEKITQVAAYLLKKAGSSLNYTAFLKLLYIADKKMLVQWGIPITYDAWCALPRGPVLSATYDLIRTPSAQAGEWGRHIQTVGYDLRLVSPPGDDLLSEAEEQTMDAVFAEYGTKLWTDLVKLTHDPDSFPEWVDPKGSSHPISHERVLEDEGFPRHLIAELVGNIEAETGIARSLANLAPVR